MIKALGGITKEAEVSNIQKHRMRKREEHPNAVKPKYCGIPVDLFWVKADLSAQEMMDYIDFLRLVYACKVRIAQGNRQDGYWLEFTKPIPGEAGLRVGRWLYGVSFSRAVE